MRISHYSAWLSEVPSIGAQVSHPTSSCWVERSPYRMSYCVTTANKLSQDASPYIRELIKNLKVAHQAARDCLKQSQERQQSYYDRSRRQRTFDIGDLVHKLDTTTKVGLTTKLKPVYTGPFLVTEILSPILYRIEDRPSVIHHNRLRICKDRAIPLWMRRKRHHFLRNLEDENLAFNNLDATVPTRTRYRLLLPNRQHQERPSQLRILQ